MLDLPQFISTILILVTFIATIATWCFLNLPIQKEKKALQFEENLFVICHGREKQFGPFFFRKTFYEKSVNTAAVGRDGQIIPLLHKKKRISILIIVLIETNTIKRKQKGKFEKEQNYFFGASKNL